MTKALKIKKNRSPAKPKIAPKDKIEGCRLVPVVPGKSVNGYPLVGNDVIENTYYRVEKKTKKVRSMVTIMPDGLHCSWDNCAVCYQYFTLCRCRAGLLHPDSVQWVKYHIESWLNGNLVERIDMSAYQKQRRMRGVSSSESIGTPPGSTTAPRKSKPSVRPWEEPVPAGGGARSKPKPKITTKTGSEKSDVSTGRELDAKAEAVGDELLDQLSEKIAALKGGKKSKTLRIKKRR